MPGNGEIKPRRNKRKANGKLEGYKQKPNGGGFAKGTAGHPLGMPNRGSLFRMQVDQAIAEAGGQKRMTQLAREDFLAMAKIRASLEPKDLNVTGQTVQVVNLIMFREEPPKDWKPYDQEEA